MAERHEQFFSGLSWLLIALFIVALALAINYFDSNRTGQEAVSAADNSSPTPRIPLEYVVFYKAGVFGPTNIRIHAGDSVRFENDSFMPIRIVSNGWPKKPELVDFDSRTDIKPNTPFLYKFLKVGTFEYYNLNNSNENGSVIVRP